MCIYAIENYCIAHIGRLALLAVVFKDCGSGRAAIASAVAANAATAAAPITNCFSPRVTRLLCVALGDGIDDWYRPFYRTLILQSTTLVRSIDTETSAVDGCRGCRVANARYVDFGIHIIYAYIYICMYVCVLNNFWNITWCCISYLLLLRNGACETQSI